MGKEEVPLIPIEGARLRVYDLDGKGLGYGTFIKVEVVREWAFDKEASDTKVYTVDRTMLSLAGKIAEAIENGIPALKIHLDSGRTIYGFECSWWEVPEKDAPTKQ